MIYKKNVFIIIYIIIALLIITIFSVNVTNNKTNQSKQQISNEQLYTLFTVKEFNGRIAVFSGENSTPDYILDGPYVRDLPIYDQQLLKSGIKAESQTELKQILEDYDG